MHPKCIDVVVQRHRIVFAWRHRHLGHLSQAWRHRIVFVVLTFPRDPKRNVINVRWLKYNVSRISQRESTSGRFSQVHHAGHAHVNTCYDFRIWNFNKNVNFARVVQTWINVRSLSSTSINVRLLKSTSGQRDCEIQILILIKMRISHV